MTCMFDISVCDDCRRICEVILVSMIYSAVPWNLTINMVTEGLSFQLTG